MPAKFDNLQTDKPANKDKWTAREFFNALPITTRERVLFDMGETAIPYVLAWETLPTRLHKALAERWGYTD